MMSLTARYTDAIEGPTGALAAATDATLKPLVEQRGSGSPENPGVPWFEPGFRNSLGT